MHHPCHLNRRRFLKSAALAGGATLALGKVPFAGSARADLVQTTSQVSLTGGTDHINNVFTALQRFKKQIAAAIGNKRVLIKPNNVIGTSNNNHGDVLLSDMTVDGLEAILEFLKSIGKTDVVIAEACATDPTLVAFENCGYFNLAKKYPVRFMDLSQGGYVVTQVWNGSSPMSKIRISKILCSPDYYVISATKPKAHNYIVATLSLKNIVMASPIVDPGTYRNVANCASEKNTMHTGAWTYQDINDNLHLIAPKVAPDLAVIDAWEGMEGNGPCWGTRVDHHCAVVSQDCLAADRVGLELMGVDPSWPAYLNYCSQTGLGQFDLSKIEVLGESIANWKRTYQLSPTISSQLGMRATPRTS